MRLATDLSLHRPDVPVVPLLQFADSVSQSGSTPWDRRFESLGVVAPDLFEMSDVEHADLVVLPTDWYWVRGSSWASRPDSSLAHRLRTLHESARDAGKPTLVFFSGDRSCDDVGLPGAYVFREGAYRSRLTPLDRPLPAFAEDLLEVYCGGQVIERPHQERPVVGFCGLATPRPWLDRSARLAVYRLVVGARERRIDPSPFMGELLRRDAIRQLEASDRVSTNFVIRDSSVFFRDVGAPSDLLEVRRQFVDNLIESDYVLCVRGSGNYSYRLYETLCLGRIPVVLDTDLALPFPDQIPWREICVWVPEEERDRIDLYIAEHHARLASNAFMAAQHRARQVWESFLSPIGYFSRLPGLLDR